MLTILKSVVHTKRMNSVFSSLLLFVSTLIAVEGRAADFRVSSTAFEANGSIPARYTCDGANINPLINIERVPERTVSLALVFDDIDAPRGSYVHWILWNIDPQTKEIQENSVPPGAVQGLNDFKHRKYGGPCPPSRAHRYRFKLYALDTRLDLSPDSSKSDLEKAMEGHVIATGGLTAKFKRERSAPKK